MSPLQSFLCFQPSHSPRESLAAARSLRHSRLGSRHRPDSAAPTASSAVCPSRLRGRHFHPQLRPDFSVGRGERRSNQGACAAAPVTRGPLGRGGVGAAEKNKNLFGGSRSPSADPLLPGCSSSGEGIPLRVSWRLSSMLLCLVGGTCPDPLHVYEEDDLANVYPVATV